MTTDLVRLVRGQNVPWPHPTIAVTCHSSFPVDVSVMLLDAGELVRSSEDLVFYNAPARPGVSLSGSTTLITLAAIEAEVMTLRCLVSVDPDQAPLGSAGCQVDLGQEPGHVEATLSLAELSTERAAVTVDVYRRAGGWWVRGVGQGWDEGLRHAVTRHGVEVDEDPSPVQQSSPDPEPQPPVVLRAVQQIDGILDDLVSTAAALASTRQYADRRLEADLEAIAMDPTLRGTAGETDRHLARAAHAELMRSAQSQHEGNLVALTVELGRLEPMLPAPLARFSAPAWRSAPTPGPTVPEVVRWGSLALQTLPGDVTVPMVTAFPGRPVLWLKPVAALAESSWSGRQDASDSVTGRFVGGMARRLLACSEPGALQIRLADIGGGLSMELGTWLDRSATPAELLESAGVDQAQVHTMITDLSRRIDLAQMALESGLPDALDEIRTPSTLFIVNDFPQYLTDDGVVALARALPVAPAAGVQVVLMAAAADVLRTQHDALSDLPDAGEDRFGGSPRGLAMAEITRSCLWLDPSGQLPLVDPRQVALVFRPD